MKLDRSMFSSVANAEDAESAGWAFMSYVEDQIRHESFLTFQEDIKSLPIKVRRLYLIQCFDVGTKGDGFDGAFSFYGYEGRFLIDEIMAGFDLLGLKDIRPLIEKAFVYWSDSESPMHTDDVPWLRMDQDLGDVQGPYFAATKQLSERVGAFVLKTGEEALHSES